MDHWKNVIFFYKLLFTLLPCSKQWTTPIEALDPSGLSFIRNPLGGYTGDSFGPVMAMHGKVNFKRQFVNFW